MFMPLGIGSLKLIKMEIEMADKSMQSPKGIVKNVLVKIDRFVFPVDFLILEIIEDEKIPIILGRHMPAIVHAKVDVYGKRMTLEVGGEEITFKANEIMSIPLSGNVCIINQVHELQEFDLEEFLNYDELIQGNSFEYDDLSPVGKFDVFVDFEENDQGIGMETEDSNRELNFIDLVPWKENNSNTSMQPIQPRFLEASTRVHHRNPYNLQHAKSGLLTFTLSLTQAPQ